MPILAYDIGSSSVKVALLAGTRPLTPIAQSPFPTCYDDGRAEVDPEKVLKALHAATAQLPRDTLQRADAIAFSVMSPSWLAIDKHGRPLTPIITHQDRRSVEQAHRINQLIGSKRYLNITGNPPIPGGISSTTFTWFLHHHPALMKRAALTGHLNTYLIHHLTGSRVIDPANASFTGLYETTKYPRAGWSEPILDALKIPRHTLPDVRPACYVAGVVSPAPAAALGLRAGTPVLTGLIDTSSAALLAPRTPGQLLNVSGTTDVLAVVTDRPFPADTHLTRVLGADLRPLWLHVATLASAGSALTWARATFFPDTSDDAYWKLVRALARHPNANNVTFSPHLAGSRTAIDQPTANFQNLTLSTTRENLLSSIIESLAHASAARLPLLRATVPAGNLLPTVPTSGGTIKTLSTVLHRDWPPPPDRKWKFHYQDQATLRGLGMLWPE